MTLSFGFDENEGLEVLRTSVKSLRTKYFDKDLARECACKAWSLCDHVFKALAPKGQFSTLSDLQRHVKHVCPDLAYAQDICNATKHGEIMRYEPSISHADANIESSPPCLEVTTLGGKTLRVIDVLECTVEFWDKFFLDHDILNTGR